MCPGRHFAKQEIIGSFALFVLFFEIELISDSVSVERSTEEKQQGPQRLHLSLEPDLRFFGLGALPPKNEIGCRIRKRRLP